MTIDAIVAELMIELLHPLRSPLLGAVAPAAGPLGATPWITELEQALAIDFAGFHDRVRGEKQQADTSREQNDLAP